jgi:cell division protein FtsL
MTLVRDRIAAFASGHLVDLTGVDGRALRAQPDRRDSRREIAHALDFAYGLDPGGRRLELASDSLPEEVLRRNTVRRERHEPRWAAIYAAADYFDDGQANVRVLVPQALVEPSDRPSRVTPSSGRSANGSASSQAPGRSTQSRSHEGGQRNPARATASRQGQRSSASQSSASRDLRTSAYDTSYGDQGPVISGATALQPHQLDRQSERHERLKDTARPSLSLVARRRRNVQGQLGIITFWTVFVVAMMFTAVVMWAQNTTRSMQLEDVNRKLAAAETSYTQLRVDVARLQSPQRIELEAARLGLSTPANITFIAPDRSVAVTSAR